MLHTHLMKFRPLAVTVAGLMLIAFTALALAQSKKAEPEPKPKLSDVLVREGKGGVRLKDPSKFEIVKQGESGGVVQFKTSKETLGSFGCGSCAGQSKACMFLMNSTGKGGSCTGCGVGNNSCTLNPF